jgi:hypothetical protein
MTRTEFMEMHANCVAALGTYLVEAERTATMLADNRAGRRPGAAEEQRRQKPLFDAAGEITKQRRESIKVLRKMLRCVSIAKTENAPFVDSRDCFACTFRIDAHAYAAPPLHQRSRWIR